MNAHVTPPQAASPATPQIDMELRAAQYIALRDKIEAMDEAHKNAKAPLVETLGQLNAVLLAGLDASKSESTRTKAGTVTKLLKKSATLADKEAFWNWVVANQAWDFLDYKANAIAVGDHLADLAEKAKTDPTIVPAPPPGVNWSTHYEAGVRRPSKK